jgi:DNA-binding CsgD family transcriptional regulator
MDRERRRRTKSEITSLCHRGLDARTVFTATGDRLARLVPFDHACWHAVDPATLLFTSEVLHNLCSEPRLPMHEYEIDDVNKWAWLARRPWPVAVLSTATHGHPQSSPRFRELLGPRGIGDELRVSFVADGLCWAFAAFYRDRRRREFSEDEAAFVAEIDAVIASGLRRALLLDAVTPPDSAPSPGPALVLVDRAGQLVGVNDVATELLAELLDDDSPTQHALPHAVLTVATRARLAASGADALPARARARTRSGRWIVLHGTRMGDDPQAPTAVIMEPARQSELAELIVAAYGLSRREREITRQVLRGNSTAAIAAALHLSPLTVQDHLKAIFTKTGVRSRRELVATIFADHYRPHLDAGEPVGPHGQFQPRTHSANAQMISAGNGLSGGRERSAGGAG